MNVQRHLVGICKGTPCEFSREENVGESVAHLSDVIILVTSAVNRFSRCPCAGNGTESDTVGGPDV